MIDSHPLLSLFSSLHLQVAPGAALLMRILEDFIHLIGEAQKPFQSFLVSANNLSKYRTVLPHDKTWQRKIKDQHHSLKTFDLCYKIMVRKWVWLFSQVLYLQPTFFF